MNDLLNREREEDLRDWNLWADEPVPLSLHVRPFGGFWYRHPLPEDAVESESFATEFARRLTIGRNECRAVLVLSRRLSLTFGGGRLLSHNEAAPNRRVAPAMKIAGRWVQFDG